MDDDHLKNLGDYHDKIVRERDELRAQLRDMQRIGRDLVEGASRAAKERDTLQDKVDAASLKVEVLLRLLTARRAKEPWHSRADHECAECDAISEIRHS